MSNNYWVGCKEFIKAQGEQLDPWSDTQGAASVHTDRCTPEQPHSHLWKITQLCAESTANSPADNRGWKSILSDTPLGRLWKISIKIKGGGRPLWEQCCCSCSKANQSSCCLQGRFAFLFQSSSVPVSNAHSSLQKALKNCPFRSENIRSYIKLFSSRNPS